MDGMVFDLEAWLPEHPGGATIIPQQALNKDCTVFFELYHASREPAIRVGGVGRPPLPGSCGAYGYHT